MAFKNKLFSFDLLCATLYRSAVDAAAILKNNLKKWFLIKRL